MSEKPTVTDWVETNLTIPSRSPKRGRELYGYQRGILELMEHADVKVTVVKVPPRIQTPVEWWYANTECRPFLVGEIVTADLHDRYRVIRERTDDNDLIGVICLVEAAWPQSDGSVGEAWLKVGQEGEDHDYRFTHVDGEENARARA